MGTRHILTPLPAGSPAFENNSRSWRGLVARARSADCVLVVVQGATVDGHQVVGRAGDVLGRVLDAPPDRVASRGPGRVADVPGRVPVGDAVALEVGRALEARSTAAAGAGEDEVLEIELTVQRRGSGGRQRADRSGELRLGGAGSFGDGGRESVF